MRARSSELPRECNNVTIRYRVRDEAPSSISSLFLVYEGEVVCFLLHLLLARALPQSNPLAPRFPANRHLHLSSAPPTTFPLLALTPTRINAEGVYYVSTTRPFICCVGQVDKGIKVAMGEECSPPLRVGCKSFCCTTLKRCGSCCTVSFDDLIARSAA